YDVYIRNRPARDQEIKDVLALRANDPARWELVRGIQKRYFALMPKVSHEVLLKHIDHIAKTAGVDHVGLGSDYDGISGMTPSGMEDVSKYPLLVKGLIKLGYSDEDIRKIMGLNLLRVLRANEQLAEKQ
ncbi:MAG: membrane dipeptidase, partial [Bryobacterales bacterium]|nr:membrane dipeptidase [Bryobacterales bacterium]